MAIDTARINLELASGRGEVTAPFQHTAQRKRNESEEAPPSDANAVAPIEVDGPLAAIPIAATPSKGLPLADRPSAGRPPWIAFIAAILAVAATVWWIMSQRLPDIDPREVIQRNLGEARQAMAEGRYTDPTGASALHYYSAVLALDPGNVDALAGIDAIADRHITDAHLLLGEQRIAEAGVALEKARRVRPNHTALAVLETQLRIELRKMLAAATAAIPQATGEPPAKPRLAKAADVPSASRPTSTRNINGATPPREVAPPPPVTAAREKAADELPAPPLPVTLDESALARIASAQAAKKAVPAPESTVAETSTSTASSPGMGASIDESSATTVLPEPAPNPVVRSAELKLVKMVQPAYPQEALMRGIEGWVDISLRVTAAGDVIEPRIEETSRGRVFNRAAIVAVQQWKYEPRGNDAPTEQVRVRLQFRQSD